MNFAQALDVSPASCGRSPAPVGRRGSSSSLRRCWTRRVHLSSSWKRDDGKLAPWTPSQTAILAEDWILIV